MKLAHLDCLAAARERLREDTGSSPAFGMLAPSTKTRDDTNFAGKRRCNLDDDEVVRTIQPSPAVLIFHFYHQWGPIARQNNIARSN